MAEHPNAALFREMDTKLSAGDFGAMMDMLADDVEWHEIGRAEPLRGKDAVTARWTSGDLANYEFSGNTHDVVANDDHTIGLVETTVRRGDKSITYRTAEIMHIRDGKITARWAFSDDTAAINEFFA
ncbi:MAG: nuclear transport factor 2 family protein [Chloroflexota bacterium]|nr:nuclear transport factor 2 family protein [Chloroflexota bacterium]